MNAHPEVAVPPESRFIVEMWRGHDPVTTESFLHELRGHRQFQAWQLPIEDVRRELPRDPTVGYARAMDAPYAAYARPRGKSRWGDKTPRYIEHIPFLARHFRQARFVHLVRDGRNVALSYAGVPFGPKTVAMAAELWARRVRLGIEAGRALPPERYLELRYEDIVADEGSLERTARTLCAFLGLGFDANMLDYGAVAKTEALAKAKELNPLVTGKLVRQTRSWQEQMPLGHIEVFELVAGDVLGRLGYERMFPDPGMRARLVAALGRKRVPIGKLKSTARVPT